MTPLILKHARKDRLGAIDRARTTSMTTESCCIGRVFVLAQAPQGRPRFWTITARAYPPTAHDRGYSATREQPMVDFKAVAGREIASPNIARTKWNPLSQPAVDLRVIL